MHNNNFHVGPTIIISKNLDVFLLTSSVHLMCDNTIERSGISCIALYLPLEYWISLPLCLFSYQVTLDIELHLVHYLTDTHFFIPLTPFEIAVTNPVTVHCSFLPILLQDIEIWGHNATIEICTKCNKSKILRKCSLPEIEIKSENRTLGVKKLHKMKLKSSVLLSGME